MPKKLFLAILLPFCLFAEEGMWPLNLVPQEKINVEYNIEIDDAWLNRAQLSCLRVSAGGSASLVSSQGLVMTNHHVASRAIYDCSSEEKDLMKEGFYAQSFEDELKCPNLYMDQLIAIQNVTDQVNRGITADMSLEEKEKLRKKNMAKIKEAAKQDTALQPEIVKLYQGALYHLYYYKRFNDIRLVMAPESHIASFGGEIENFEFPRHCLDVTFFRIYENGKPLNNQEYFRWSLSGPQFREPLFVLGHPGRTERLFTKDHLIFYRDHAYPIFMDFLKGKLRCFNRFALQGDEEARIADQDKHRFSNALKAYAALEKGLNEQTIISEKGKSELLLLATLNEKEQQPWTSLALALNEAKDYYTEHFYLEGTAATNLSKLYTWARHFVRLSEEIAKPNELRLKEYIDSELPTLELSLLSEEPLYLEYERELFIDGLERMKKGLGADHPAMQAALAGKTPQDCVNEIFRNSRLFDLETRREWVEHPESVKTSTDPLILFAKALDPYARTVREKMTQGLDAAKDEHYAKISHLLFDRFGETMYPDATFTLRLSIGELMGYPEQRTFIHPLSTIREAYRKANDHHHQDPFMLPPSWVEKEGVVDQNTPFNFVSTHDIIGGNSGSPMINAKQEIVGLIFDGNVHSLTWDFEFNQNQGRAVSVHSSVIIHALNEIYGADRLVKELLRG
ncbi:MAG: S46 family peptidase [Chlamydiia bacterium]|nr:S46 family peptidase [Chlamydiia bacterium]